MIEQSDLFIAVWDGKHHNLPGGTGHSIVTALDLGSPVLWIDPAQPERWAILQAPESLHSRQEDQESRDELLAEIMLGALRPDQEGIASNGQAAMHGERWHLRSSRLASTYLRIEIMFGGEGRRFRSLVQTYEAPERIAEGSGTAMLASARALPGKDEELSQAIASTILPQFAWADAVSARLSDVYRSGMVANFILSAMAVTGGIAYLPLKLDQHKWAFALTEFLLLGLILLITWLGGRWNWHARWFETRRVAEYLRHAPVLLILGVARSTGRWPRGKDTNWPEYHARHALRALGLPQVAVTRPYLRGVLENLLDKHVAGQRDYHLAKARRLTTVHHRLDRLSERLFILAVVSVAIWLLLAAGGEVGLLPQGLPSGLAKLFTFLGVLFPTWGAAIAGIRFFGDFERFAAISEITAEKLDGIHSRITLLLGVREENLRFSHVAEIAHEVDEVVVSGIENWQSVFGGKHITVPA